MEDTGMDHRADDTSAQKDVPYQRGPKLEKNLVVQDLVTSARYRVLYLPKEDSSDATGYWIRLDKETNVPKAFSPADIQEKLSIGVAEAVIDVETTVPNDVLSQKSIDHRDKAWGLINHIVTMEPDIYIPRKRTDLLKAVETTSGIPLNNLYGYLGKYWRSGFQKNALAPKYRNCGGARVAVSMESRPGRRKRKGNNGKVLDDHDLECFQTAIKRFYQQGQTLRQAYDSMLSLCYVRERFKGDPAPVTMGEDEKPSFGQFYYWYHKNGNPVQDTRCREGEEKFDREYRAILGRTQDELFGPGASYQVDATIGDFYLVMESDRSRLVGRPIIVFFKDAWSRMVTGMYITLENSSCQVWKEALANTLRNKVDFCKGFGISITREEWPCEVMPASITTDNGEFAVKAIDEVVRDLGITVESCPPYRGDLKGIIERTFRTYQMHLKPYIPGHVEKDAGTRGAKDYRKDACLDLRTFIIIMIKLVLFYNNHHYMAEYPRTEDMRNSNVPAIPLHLWNYGVAHKAGALRTMSPEEYLPVLLPKGTAAVTGRGIRLNGLYYTCDVARSEKWFEKARINGTYEVSVLYDPASCAHIHVRGGDGKYISCSLVSSSAQYEGYSHAEKKEAANTDLDTQASYTQAENQADSDLTRFINNCVERCKKEKKNGSTIIKALNKHSIDENREMEMRDFRGESEARKAQETMGLGHDTDSDDPTGQGTTETADDKPRSYQSISDDIDKVLDEMGLGNPNPGPMQ